MRKVIQITTTSNAVGESILHALCDDGTAWEMQNGHWHEMPPIPQDESKDPLAEAVAKMNAVRLYAESYRDSANADRRAFGINILRRLDSKG